MRVAEARPCHKTPGLLLAVLLGMLSLPLWASPPLVLQGPVAATAVEPHVDWLCDPGGQLTLDEVRQRRLTPLNRHTIAFGYRRGACWFHFQLENRHTQPLLLILQLGFPPLDRIELFAPGSSEPYVLTGDMQPYAQRPRLTRTYNFPISLEPGQRQDYFLRIASTSAFNVPLIISSREYFLSEQEAESWLNGAGFGIAIGLIVYHLFLWLAVREQVFRSYVIYVTAGFLYLLCFNGIAYRFWPDSPNWNAHAQLFFLCIMLAAAALFARDYLGGGALGSRARLTLRIVMGASLALAGLQFVLPLELGYPLQPVLTIPAVLLIVAVALPYLRGTAREARIFLLGWAVVIAMALLLSLQSLGLLSSLPILITVRGMEITFILQQLLLALALADRLNVLKREKAEKEQAALRAEAESAAKTEFLARMSHEIRTPMNAMLGMTQLLQHTALDQAQQHYVDTVLGSGNALLHVIDDILDYSKIIAGKVELEMIDFNLPALLDECLEMFRPQAREKSLTLVTERAPDLPVHVRGDSSRLRQILLNLLSNAIKFTAAGTVCLRASVAQRSATHVGLRLEVEDSGVGIAPDKLPLLFTPFTQADSSTARQYGGSGLGLVISQQLAELMHGQISVSSTPGRGTLFCVTVLLKLATGPAQPAPVPAIDAYRFTGKRALVVEDNPINKLVIIGLLHRLGVDAQVVDSGAAALETLQRQPKDFDIVFMDCEMPVMDGFETTRRLRRWEQEEGLKPQVVVALTAHALPEYRHKCLAAGMNDYLSKPLLLNTLAGKLQNLLG